MTPVIAAVGPFDVVNLGDLLFPLVAEHELGRRLDAVDIRFYGVGDRASFDGRTATRAARRLPDELDDVDLLLVGGGDIVRFDQHELAEHPAGRIDFVDLWLNPTLAAHARGIPVVWNAVGVPRRVIGRRRAVLASVARKVRELAVRDPRSAALVASGEGVRPKVVPDTVFGVGKLLEPPAAPVVGQRDYIVVQGSPWMRRWRRQLEAICDQADAAGLDVLELPISPDLRDRPGAAGLGARATQVDGRWSAPLRACEIIRGARAVVGHSLHLSIVAAISGVPAFRPPPGRVKKHAIAADLPTVRHLGRRAAPRLGAATRSPAGLAPALSAALEQHWDRVAATIGGGGR